MYFFLLIFLTTESQRLNIFRLVRMHNILITTASNLGWYFQKYFYEVKFGCWLMKKFTFHSRMTSLVSIFKLKNLFFFLLLSTVPPYEDKLSTYTWTLVLKTMKGRFFNRSRRFLDKSCQVTLLKIVLIEKWFSSIVT